MTSALWVERFLDGAAAAADADAAAVQLRLLAADDEARGSGGLRRPSGEPVETGLSVEEVAALRMARVATSPQP